MLVKVLIFAVFCIFLATSAFTATHYTNDYRLKSEVIVEGLQHPWSFAFISKDKILVTERPGAMRLIENGQVSVPIKGVPRAAVRGQGGLLDVVLSPDFQKSGLIFFSYAEPGRGGAGTAVMRAELDQNTSPPSLKNKKVIFRMNKKTGAGRHFGSRIVIAADGTLFITTGDRGERDRSQDFHDHAGAVARINKDGSIPADNPFKYGKKGLPELWSKGHRNPQGAALDPVSGTLWTVEHGARGGDEVNRPEAGKNYGWPIISYGRNYSGTKIGIGKSAPGLQQPVFFWDPSIAPSDAVFVPQESLFPKWRGNLIVGALKYQMLVRLQIKSNKIIGEENILRGAFGRVRDVDFGPDGALYLITDANNGKLIRLTPVSQ